MLSHLPFIARNAVRNRRRSILATLSIAVSLCLLGVLLALYQGMFHPDDISAAQALRLVIHHRVSLGQGMPSAYLQRIAATPGVRAVSTWQWFGGTYKDARNSKNFFARLGVDPGQFFTVRPDLYLPIGQQRDFERVQTGAIASSALAKELNWKIGDRITLIGDIFPVTLELTLVGIFTEPVNDLVLYYNYHYLEESLPAGSEQRDIVSAYLALVDNTADVPRAAKAIDADFANSPAPTKTESEKDFALSFLAFLGNLKLFLAAICGAVIFTILLVSANTVAMTVRERVRETAILRTIGFTPAEIRGLVLAEAGLLSAIGGVLGALLAAVLCYCLHGGPNIDLPLVTPAISAIVIAVAFAVGLISAAGPAYFASRRSVLDSLRDTG
jgi:putative ABC transport system permease protein